MQYTNAFIYVYNYNVHKYPDFIILSIFRSTQKTDYSNEILCIYNALILSQLVHMHNLRRAIASQVQFVFIRPLKGRGSTLHGTRYIQLAWICLRLPLHLLLRSQPERGADANFAVVSYLLVDLLVYAFVCSFACLSGRSLSFIGSLL